MMLVITETDLEAVEATARTMMAGCDHPAFNVELCLRKAPWRPQEPPPGTSKTVGPFSIIFMRQLALQPDRFGPYYVIGRTFLIHVESEEAFDPTYVQPVADAISRGVGRKVGVGFHGGRQCCIAVYVI